MFAYSLPFTLSRHVSSCVGFVVIRSGIWGCFWPIPVDRFVGNHAWGIAAYRSEPAPQLGS